jgi:hypothetical protein
MRLRPGGARGRRARRAGTGLLAAGLLSLAAGACSSLPHYHPEQTFYVSPGGDDRQDGLSASHAWRTLGHADAHTYKPGDRLLLQGGAHFRGQVTLRQGEAGRAANPVVIGSYGTGRATIQATGLSAVSVSDTAGVDIQDLVVRGSPQTYQADAGIDVFDGLASGTTLQHITVSRVDVAGFHTGIQVGAAHPGNGFAYVRISDSAVHGNNEAGILTYGPDFDARAPAYANRDVTVTGVEAADNAGDPRSTAHHTGSGIILGSVDRGLVSGSSAHDNGLRSSTQGYEGPVGIWGYDSTRLVFEHDTSYRNHTGSTVDGSGFGLDRNVSDSTVQYDLAFGNDGPGYHAFTNVSNGAHHGNTIRFDISSDDGRKLSWNGGIDIHGTDVRALEVHNNTVVMTNTGQAQGPAIRLRGTPTGVAVRNNLFITDGPPVVIASAPYTPAQVVMQGNDYVSTAGRWTVRWGERDYPGLAAWRADRGQESVGATATGVVADACLAGGPAPVITTPGQAGAMLPRCAAAVSEGLDLHARFGVDPGPADYFGAPVVPVTLLGAAAPPRACSPAPTGAAGSCRTPAPSGSG